MDRKKELQTIKDVIKKRKLRADFCEILERDDLAIEEKILDLTYQALNRIILVDAVFSKEDIDSIGGNEFYGVKTMIEEIHSLLDVSTEIQFNTI